MADFNERWGSMDTSTEAKSYDHLMGKEHEVNNIPVIRTIPQDWEEITPDTIKTRSGGISGQKRENKPRSYGTNN